LKKIKYLDITGLIIFGLSLFVSRAGMNVGMGLLLISFLIKLVFDRKEMIFNNKISNYLLLIYIGGAFWNLFSDNGVSSFLIKFESQYRLLTVLLLLNAIKDRKVIKKFLIAIEISFLVSIIYGIINWFRYNEGRLQSFGGCMTYAHPLALALVVHLAFIFKEGKLKNKIFFIIIEILGILALILTQTRGAWLGFIGGAIIFFILSKKYKYILVFSVILSLTFLIMPLNFKNRVKSIVATRSDSSNNARLNLWGAAIWTYKENIVFGSGEGNNKKWFNLYKEKEKLKDMNIYNGNSHNMYLHFLSQNGLWIILYLFFLFYIIPKEILQRLKKNPKDFFIMGISGGIVSFYISGLTENVWYHEYPGYAILILFFLLAYNSKENNNNEVDKK